MIAIEFYFCNNCQTIYLLVNHNNQFIEYLLHVLQRLSGREDILVITPPHKYSRFFFDFISSNKRKSIAILLYVYKNIVYICKCIETLSQPDIILRKLNLNDFKLLYFPCFWIGSIFLFAFCICTFYQVILGSNFCCLSSI